MLEVSVSVWRGAVLFAGETFRCLVTFTNTGAEPEEVAWGTAQTHCRCTTNRNRVHLPLEAGGGSGGEPSGRDSFAFTPTKGVCVCVPWGLVQARQRCVVGLVVDTPFLPTNKCDQTCVPRHHSPSRPHVHTYAYIHAHTSAPLRDSNVCSRPHFPSQSAPTPPHRPA